MLCSRPRRHLLVLGVGVVLAILVAAVGAARPASGAIFYCNTNVPPGYQCGPQNVYDYQANVNQAYVSQQPGRAVCERATVRYHAQNVSLRCGGGPIDSGCDMLYSEFGPYVVFSMYAIDNEPPGFLTEYLVGKASHSSNVCV